MMASITAFLGWACICVALFAFAVLVLALGALLVFPLVLFFAAVRNDD